MDPTTVVVLARRATTVATETSTASSSPGGDSGGQTPFLYFIALGLGIVFTNLWVILGLKYCCRHRRRRLMGITDSDSLAGQDDLAFYLNPIMGPADIHRRRRRERKVLTQEELDTRFPVQKYEEWGRQREKEGLSATGGISSGMAEEVAATLVAKGKESMEEHEYEHEHDHEANEEHNKENVPEREQEIIITESDEKSADEAFIYAESSTLVHTTTINEENMKEEDAENNNNNKIKDDDVIDEVNEENSDINITDNNDINSDRNKSFNEPTFNEVKFAEPVFEDVSLDKEIETADPDKIPASTDQRSVQSFDSAHLHPSTSDHHSHDEDSDDEFGVTLAPLNVDSPGDMCAVCLDNIEPDSDIRGLTCGHVFHDECITPWLTTRRACCPLCKKDYWVKKPRVVQDRAFAPPATAPPEPTTASTQEGATSTDNQTTYIATDPQSPGQAHVHGRRGRGRTLMRHFRYGPAVGFQGHIDPTVPRRQQENYVRIPFM